MKELTLFTVEAPYRQSLPVKAWHFGDCEKKSLAVVGALRGNEIQQMYICSRLIRRLSELEESGSLHTEAFGMMIVPCANRFSMNEGRRFWAADNTDINRMFPGYEGGETTQRIAGRLFNAIDGYAYGVHVTSIYLPGNIMPHLRVMETGYEDINEGLAFGLPYVLVRKPHPYDTTTLNYNWQIWNTCTFSLYTHETDVVDVDAADEAVDAVIRFMVSKGWCDADVGSGYYSRILPENVLRDILSTRGGLLLRETEPGESVEKGQLLGRIIDPCSGLTAEELFAPCSGKLFFAHKAHLISGHDVAFRILPENE